MTENKKFKLVFDENGKPIEIKGGYTRITSLEQVVDTLNDLNSTVYYHLNTINKLKSLLDEKVEPTKRCKYERTFICDKCSAYSTYFLDCRLMMGDDQYKKALQLGLVKEND